MRKSLTVLLVSALVLTSCGSVRDSRLNPFNWFGRSAPVEVTTDERNALVPRRGMMARPDAVYQGRPIDRVIDVSVDPMPGGAIVRATGVAARQGPYEVQLTPVTSPQEAEGRLSFTFDIVLPGRDTPVGPESSRMVTVATFVTDKDLAGAGVIRVIGARNAQESRRR
ncbi:MAG: hypothetical protein ACLFRU_10660 [Paracoccaceae bacterium]